MSLSLVVCFFPLFPLVVLMLPSGLPALILPAALDNNNGDTLLCVAQRPGETYTHYIIQRIKIIIRIMVETDGEPTGVVEISSPRRRF